MRIVRVCVTLPGGPCCGGDGGMVVMQVVVLVVDVEVHGVVIKESEL
jgi:hypothetical protein